MLGPESLEFMDSPFGFIFGFSRKLWDRDIMMNVDKLTLDGFNENAIILEIDKDYIKTQIKPVIPHVKRLMIEESLQKLINEREEKVINCQDFTHKHSQMFWKSLERKTKRLFLNFFITTINNYLGFYKTSNEINTKQLMSEKIFDFEKYISSFPSQEQDFISQLTMTQSFNVFIGRL